MEVVFLLGAFLCLVCAAPVSTISIFRAVDEETGQMQWMDGNPGVKVNGGHSYEGPNGTIFNLTFTADENGYQPEGSHLPTQVEDTKEVQDAKTAFFKLFKEAENADAVEGLQKKIAQFVPVDLTADISYLPESEKMALQKLIEAAQYMDPIFNLQAWKSYPEAREKLSGMSDSLSKAQLEYFDIMRGPWDRQEHHKAFATESEHPDGAGYYPEDLTEEEFVAYVKSHPEQKEELENLVTMIHRENNQLVATPYSIAFSQWLVPAANKMKEAAMLTQDPTLKTFLNSRAAAFLSDDYYQSDKDWMDLDSTVEITIGPYEVYEDKLMGLKASFESFVTITDPVESKKLHVYKSLLPEMEQNLPVPDKVKNNRGSESPIKVVDLVFSSGDARKSVQTIAFNLPNDERVRKEKGAKKVMLRNSINTKFNAIMKPIADKIIDSEQLVYLNQDAFFYEVLFHELSHSLGPAFVGNNEENGPISKALKASYTSLEEGKADAMGAYNILFMIKKGLFPEEFRKQLLLSYFAGLFRSVRFGVAESHGKGAAMQINRYVEEGGATYSKQTGKYHVDFDQLEKSIGNLVTDICMWQHNGDKDAVDEMFETYGKLSEDTTHALSRVEDVAVDIKPTYLLAGE